MYRRLFFGPPNAEVGAALGQPDERKRLSLRVEHHDAVEILGLAPQLVDLAAAHVGGLRASGRRRCPTRTRVVAVAVYLDLVERALVGGVDQLHLVG